VSGSEARKLTVFGVSLVELVFRVPPHPDAWEGVLAAERHLLAMQRLEAEPGVSCPELVILAAGVLGMAAAAVQADDPVRIPAGEREPRHTARCTRRGERAA
jgi:hypothetical protein